MHIDNLGFALPILVLAILIALLKLLRHLLRTPSPAPRTSTTGQAGAVHAPDANATDPDPWNRITSRWNRWITWVLPVPVGICILALAVWFLAYLGWGTVWLVDRPTAMAGVPPWFGNAGLFAKNALYGFIALFVGTAFGVVLALFSHAIGKCLIWPEVCGCDDEQGRGH